jgi:hypothetical protein
MSDLTTLSNMMASTASMAPVMTPSTSSVFTYTDDDAEYYQGSDKHNWHLFAEALDTVEQQMYSPRNQSSAGPHTYHQ